MDRMVKKRKDRKRRQMRARQIIKGTADRPRLAVYRSLRHIYAQLIDDVAGTTLASASTNTADYGKDKAGGNIKAAEEIGRSIAAKAKEKSIESVVFDRGGRNYHGRVKALAEAAREAGMKF